MITKMLILQVFPLAYLLMERKTDLTYSELFSQLDRFILGEVKEVMTDYEAALRKAIKKAFPATSLSGCFFHFGQAVYRRGRALQLPDFQQGSTALKMAMALPLLPPDFINEGIDLSSWVTMNFPIIYKNRNR